MCRKVGVDRVCESRRLFARLVPLLPQGVGDRLFASRGFWGRLALNGSEGCNRRWPRAAASRCRRGRPPMVRRLSAWESAPEAAIPATADNVAEPTGKEEGNVDPESNPDIDVTPVVCASIADTKAADTSARASRKRGEVMVEGASEETADEAPDGAPSKPIPMPFQEEETEEGGREEGAEDATVDTSKETDAKAATAAESTWILSSRRLRSQQLLSSSCPPSCKSFSINGGTDGRGTSAKAASGTNEA